jgi:hypothetical protein
VGFHNSTVVAISGFIINAGLNKTVAKALFQNRCLVAAEAEGLDKLAHDFFSIRNKSQGRK